MKLYKSFFAYLFVPIFISFLFIDCSSARLQKKVEQPVKNEKALLWKISGKDLKQPSWLFGTIHMIDADKFFLPEGTDEAFASSKLIYFEVDMGLMDDPAEQMALLQKSYMNDGITLKDLLTQEDYNLVKAHFADMGMPLFLLERIKPMFLTVLTDESIMEARKDKDKLKFYEFEFMEMARTQKKEVKGLEGIEFQMGLMDSIPYEDQAQMLVDGIKAKQDGSQELDQLFIMYLDQDIDGMHNSFASDSIARFDSLLLINRNRNWIPIMLDEVKKQSTFFAVGAAHLGGKDGVIALLKKEGLTLEAVLD